MLAVLLFVSHKSVDPPESDVTRLAVQTNRGVRFKTQKLTLYLAHIDIPSTEADDVMLFQSRQQPELVVRDESSSWFAL